MDITIKVKDRFGKMQSSTFIGDKKEDVVQDMQKYIDKNRNKFIYFSVLKKSLSNLPTTNCLIPNK